jgi:Tfp pilus assembly protein PilZ
MEKRAFERLPVNLQARLFYGNMVYSGIVTNLSEKGMFISTKMGFFIESALVIVIQLSNNSLKVPIRVRRTVKANRSPEFAVESGVGVEVFNASQEYLDYVSSCRPLA